MAWHKSMKARRFRWRIGAMARQCGHHILVACSLLLTALISCSLKLAVAESVVQPNVAFEAALLRWLHPSQTAITNGTGEVGADTIAEAIDFIFTAPTVLNETFDKAPELAYQAFFDIVDSAKPIASGEVIPAGDLLIRLNAITRQVAALPNHLCWPVLRRVLLGALVKRHLAQGTFSPEVQAAATRLCAQLFLLHKQAAARKGVIDFFHVSKAGGTTFCQLAKLNGCRTQSFAARRNCLIREFDDVPRWVNKSLHLSLAPQGLRTPWFVNFGTKPRNTVSCRIRKRFMLRRRFNVLANEFTVYGASRVARNAHVCPGNLNILQLREPQARLRSHLMWVWALYDHTFKEQAPAFFPAHGLAHWRALMPAATDNYYIRSLLGEAVYFLPAANLTHRHLAAAKLAVTQFDILLLLEQPSMSELLYEMAVGWGLGFGSVHARTSSQVHEIGRQGLPEPAEWEQLLLRNRLDGELYRFGTSLALLDAIVFDVARAAGLGSGYSSVAGSGEGEGGGSATVTGQRAVAPGDDEQWELQGKGNGNSTRRASCGFVSEYDSDAPLPTWLVV